MGETACLRRSFSNPSQITLDFSQGDPARALGDSISFGKYTSEALAWEKWSAFTSNRYLEEAEKSSKPGSVAKMKAYFEAHYGRFGAKKTLQNDVSSRSSVHESPTEDNPDVDSLSSAQLNDKQNDVDSSAGPVVLADVVNSLPEDDAVVDASVTGSSSKNNGKETEENDVVSTAPETKVTVKSEAEKEKPEKEKPDLISEQNLADCSIKSSKKSSLSKLSTSLSRLATPKRCKTEGDGTPNKKVSKLSSSLSRLATPKRCKKEGDGTPNRKVSKLSSSLARLSTPVRPRMEGHVTPSSRMLVREPLEKKKLISKTLHTSINNSSDINVMKKPSPSSRKSGVGNVFTPLRKIIRDSFASSSTPSRASVNSVSRHPSATPRTEIKKSRIALEKSFDRSRRLERNLKSPSIVNVKSSTQSPATFSSFSFRTEERAAKRREFFEKRMEKEAENLQALQHIDKSKIKPTPDSRKSSHLTNVKANSAAYIRTEVLSDSIKKIAPSRQPPKCEAKPASDMTRDKAIRPFQRTVGSKPSSEKNKTLPSNLMVKKKRHENASPNIM